MRKRNAGTLVTVFSVKERLWWLWLTFSNYTCAGKRSWYKNFVKSKMSDYNFWAVRIRIFSFLQDYWSSPLLYAFSAFSPQISSPPLSSAFLSSLLSPLRGKLQMTLFPLPYHLLCSLCCYIFSNISRQLKRQDDWRGNRETEGCDEGENKEKRKHLSDGRGGFQTPHGLNTI